MSEWISVKKALPEYGKWVIVFNGFYGIASYKQLDIAFPWSDYNGEEWCCVTHWHPLPEPPK